MLVGPDETAVGSVSGGCVEGAVYDLAQSVVESGRAGAAAVRRLRRRRVRGRAHLRRHPRRLRREGLARRPSPSSARSPPTSRPAARSRWPPSSSTPTPPGWAAGSSYARDVRRRRPPVRAPDARLAAGGRRGPRRRDGAAGGRAQRDAHLRSRRRAARRGDAGLRVGVRAQAAAAGLRRHRLRGRGGPGRRLPRLPRHRLRRPAGVRDEQPVPGGRRRGRRLAAPLPDGRARGRPDRPAHRGHRADPRPEVRRTAARGRAAAARGGLRRRDGLAAYPRRPDGPAARGRARARRSWTGCPARSVSTSAPGRRRRPRSASRPRSSPAAGAAAGSGSASPTAGSTARRTRWADHPYTGHAPYRRRPRRRWCWRAGCTSESVGRAGRRGECRT